VLQGRQVIRKLISRGLRIKVGIATGQAVDIINHATGQMSYRGKLMNRAARISSVASTGQVLAINHPSSSQSSVIITGLTAVRLRPLMIQFIATAKVELQQQ
jgi:hypothetical protein